MLARRSLILGVLAAPTIIRTPGLLMPIKTIKNPASTGDIITRTIATEKSIVEPISIGDIMTMSINDQNETWIVVALASDGVVSGLIEVKPLGL